MNETTFIVDGVTVRVRKASPNRIAAVREIQEKAQNDDPVIRAAREKILGMTREMTPEQLVGQTPESLGILAIAKGVISADEVSAARVKANEDMTNTKIFLAVVADAPAHWTLEYLLEEGEHLAMAEVVREFFRAAGM
jgi:hypothetical protein